MANEVRLFICQNCFNAVDAEDAHQPCAVCGHEFIECRPGDPDDPCRKPLMDADGDLITHAPQWWVDEYKKLAS